MNTSHRKHARRAVEACKVWWIAVTTPPRAVLFFVGLTEERGVRGEGRRLICINSFLSFTTVKYLNPSYKWQPWVNWASKKYTFKLFAVDRDMNILKKKGKKIESEKLTISSFLLLPTLTSLWSRKDSSTASKKKSKYSFEGKRTKINIFMNPAFLEQLLKRTPY